MLAMHQCAVHGGRGGAPRGAPGPPRGVCGQWKAQWPGYPTCGQCLAGGALGFCGHCSACWPTLPGCRAYKLGKKRWSYNQVELVLGEEGGTRTAAVQQALHASGAKFPEAHQVHSGSATTYCRGCSDQQAGLPAGMQLRPMGLLGQPRRTLWRCHPTPCICAPAPFVLLQDSAVGFLIQLESGVKVQAHVYLCYDRQPGDACGASGSGRGRGPALVPGSDHFAW